MTLGASTRRYLTTDITELRARPASPGRMHDIPGREFTSSIRRDRRRTSGMLLLQLNGWARPITVAASIVRDHLPLLGAKKYPEIAKALGISAKDVQETANFISTLNPKPGMAYTPTPRPTAAGDHRPETEDGSYSIILNDDQLPGSASEVLSRADERSGSDANVKTYIRNASAPARF